MDYKLWDKFKEELTRRLQEYYKTNYNYDAVVQEKYDSRNFKINGVPSSNCLRVYFKRDKVSINDSNDFNFPVDELRIRHTSPWKGKGEDVLFQVDFHYRSTSIVSYNFKGPQIDSLFDVLAKYVKPDNATWSKGGNPDVYIWYDDMSFYKVSTSHGEDRARVDAFRDPNDKTTQYFRVNFNIDYGYSKWVRYLKNNVITVTDDESTWNDAINKILNVITTINKEVANYVKEIALGTLNEFIDKVKDIIKLQGN